MLHTHSQELHLSHENGSIIGGQKDWIYEDFNHVIRKSNYAVISSLVISILITVPFCREED